jgi:DNA polymerase III epsilon subunit-like protein
VPPGTDRPLAILLDPGFVAIDVETTGLNPRRDAVVAIAAIPFEAGRAGPGLVSLINPGRPIPTAATAIHGIDDAAVTRAPALDAVLPRFDAVCAGQIVVGHDVTFDLAVLARARGAAPPQVNVMLDTRRLARAARPDLRDTRLETLAARLGISAAGRHTADGDARMAGQILIALLPMLSARGVATLADALRLQRLVSPYD